MTVILLFNTHKYFHWVHVSRDWHDVIFISNASKMKRRIWLLFSYEARWRDYVVTKNMTIAWSLFKQQPEWLVKATIEQVPKPNWLYALASDPFGNNDTWNHHDRKRVVCTKMTLCPWTTGLPCSCVIGLIKQHMGARNSKRPSSYEPTLLLWPTLRLIDIEGSAFHPPRLPVSV